MITNSMITEKIKRNIKNIGADLREYPAQGNGIYFTDRDKRLKLGHIFNWTQSFFTGMAYWAYVDTGDREILDWMLSFEQIYYDKVFKTPLETMHDLGFLYIPYAVALYKLTGSERMKDMGIKAADELAKRFNPKGDYIRAWGRMDYKTPEYVDPELAKDHFFTESKGLAIIDCMMNIPLLFWAGKVTGSRFYERIAMAHADTTMKYFIREDFSVKHSYVFSEETGEPIGEKAYCGYGIGSYWARGTAWAIYGFMCAYKYTKEEKYLDLSKKLLDRFMEECHGDIPVWDFRLPDNEPKKKDTSALAIVLSAVNELIKTEKSDKLERFRTEMTEKLMNYIDISAETDGLMKGQNGEDVYAVYGDYYLVEYLFGRKYPDAVIW